MSPRPTESSTERAGDDAPELPGLRPAPGLGEDAHKGSAGRVLCITGSATLPGAAVLSARAALRGGAGLVTVGCLDPNLLVVVPAAVPEAILLDLTAVFGVQGEGRSRDDLRAALGGGREPDALLVGPGLGQGERTRIVVQTLLDFAPGAPRIFDADALNAVAGEPEVLATSSGPIVITPHPGEAARLLGREVPDDPEGRAACARELARRARAVCCLKGRGTVVTDGTRVFENPTGNAGLATAGTGDVLAGLMAAYLARTGRGEPPFEVYEAAALAVWVHGAAGDLAARVRGQRSLVASDVIEELGTVHRSWE